MDNVAGSDPKRMDLGADGKIVVVGTHLGRWFGIRFTANGAPDPAFGGASGVTHKYQRGIVTPAETAGFDVAVMPGGYVVFLVDTLPGFSRAALVRFTPNGAVDLEFGDPKADGDGWSVLGGAAHPFYAVAGAEGRVMVMSQYAQSSGNLVERDVWVHAIHSY